MQAVDAMILARWVIPVEPAGAVIENGAVAIADGRIAGVMPAHEARTAFAPRVVHERPEHVLIPGLVNAHTHAAMSLFRGLADDLQLMDWLHHHIWPAETRHVGADFVRVGSELACIEMLRGGTTCFADMYFFPDVTGRVAADLGLRAVVGLIVIDAPTVWASRAEEYLARAGEVHDAFRGEPLVTTAFAPHAPYSVGDRPLERIGVLAEELDIPVHMHVHETAYETESAAAQTGRRPLERLESLGLLPRLLAVHMTQLTEAEIAAVAHHGVNVAHCPESNLKLASGACPVDSLLGAGVNVCLGTDGAASNNDLDMLGEMRTAALLAKGTARDPTALPAEQALEMATLGGARALGLAHRIGSLSPGKEADIVCVDLGEPETQPVYDPASQLVYAASRHAVTDVWVSGRQVLDARVLPEHDVARTLAEAARWRDRVAATDSAEPTE